MNTRTPLIRAALAATLVGCAFTFTSPATPAYPAVAVSVEARAPLHATLLPVVSVVAEATHPDGVAVMRVAATEGLPVTLLPTVHVSARLADFVAATPRTKRVAAAATVRFSVDDDLARADMPRAKPVADAMPVLRGHVMPR